MVKQQNLKQDFPSVCKIHTISLCSLLFVLTITAEEVIQHLADYLGEPGCGTHVDTGKFMVYLQKEQKASTPEHLGVLVQSLGQIKALAPNLKCKTESLGDSSDHQTGGSGKKVAAVKEGIRAAATIQEIVEKLLGASG
ncbi:unnamed protein product [Sphagnum tenellum]